MSVDPVSFQILGSLLSFGPLGREEFVQAGGGPATGELVEYLDEVGPRVDPSELAGRHQRVDHGEPLAPSSEPVNSQLFRPRAM